MFARMLLNCTSVILHHNQTVLIPGDLSADMPMMMTTNPLGILRDPQEHERGSRDCCPLVVLSVVKVTRQIFLQSCMSKTRQRGARFLLITENGFHRDDIQGLIPYFDCFLTYTNNLGKSTIWNFKNLNEEK